MCLKIFDEFEERGIHHGLRGIARPLGDWAAYNGKELVPVLRDFPVGQREVQRDRLEKAVPESRDVGILYQLGAVAGVVARFEIYA